MSTNGWPMTPLGELLTRNDRVATVDPTEEYREVKVRLWGNGVELRRVVSGAELSGRRFQVSTDQFILSRIDARNGAMGLIPPELDGAVVTNDFPTFDAKRPRLLPSFLGWLSKTPSFVDACRAVSEGTTNRVRLKEDKFLQLPIPLPPLEEQQRIVARIDYLAERIEEVRDTRQLADDETQALLRSRFSQLVESAPRQRMDDVAPLTRRKAEIREGETYAELGIRCFGNGTFHKPALDFLSVGTKKLYSIEPGDLVFSNVFAWEGAIAVAQPEDGGRYGSHRFITCVAEPGVAIADFLCFYFLTPEGMEQIGEASPGGAGRNRTLGLKKLAEIEVPVPDFEQQQEFADLLRKVRQMQREKDATAAELDAFLPSILDRAFRGEL